MVWRLRESRTPWDHDQRSDVKRAQQFGRGQAPVDHVGAEHGGGLLPGEDLLGVDADGGGPALAGVSLDAHPALRICDRLAGDDVMLVRAVLAGDADLDRHHPGGARALDVRRTRGVVGCHVLGALGAGGAAPTRPSRTCASRRSTWAR